MENKMWKELSIKEVAKKLTSGGTPSTKNPTYYEGGTIPWLNTKEIDFKRILSTEKFITDEGLKNSSAKWIDKDSVIVAMYGATAAKVAINKIPLTTNQACCNIIVNNDLCDYEFLYYNIFNKYSELENIAVGAAQQNLSVGVIGDFKLMFPPLPEQKAIASVLSSLDDKIDLLQQQNQTLEALAEALFRQWFIEEAKEDWEEVKLKTVVDIGIGRTPPRKESQWFSTNDQDVKWISIKDLGSEGAFIFNTSEYLTNEAVVKFNIPIIPKDTVLLSFKMTVGRVAITTEEMLSNEAIAHFKFNDKTPFTKEYLYLFLKYYKYETLGSTSSIVTSINSAMIKDMEITIPDEFTMRNFNESVFHYFNKIKENSKQIQTLTKLRDTLLPKLMSGEVRVKV